MLRWLLGIAIGVSACHPGLASDQTPSWHLNTADTTVVITVRQDAPLVTWLGSTGNHQNWLAVPITEELLPVVSQKGVAVPAHWTYSGQSFDRPNGKLILRFTNAVPALELQSIWQGRTGHGPIEHWLTITNHSGNTITAGHQDSLVLNVNAATDRPMQAWWVKRGGGNASTEGGTLNASIGKSFDVLLNSDPLDGASPVPWLALQSSQDRGLYVGWEFSGLGRIHASAPTSLSSLKIEVGNRPEFKTDIAPEEMLIVPPAFVGCYTGDIDDGSYTLHRFVLEKLRPNSRLTIQTLPWLTICTSIAEVLMPPSKVFLAVLRWRTAWASRASYWMQCGFHNPGTGALIRRVFRGEADLSSNIFTPMI